MNLRQQNIEKRRRAILDAAREIITDEGAEALSMRTMAKRAGFAVATLYNLFGGRDEILFALINDGLSTITGSMHETVEDDPSSVFMNVTTHIARSLIENKRLYHPILAAGYHNVPTRSDSRNIATYTELIRITAGLLKSIQKQGRMRDGADPELLAAEIFYMYRNTLEDWACDEIDDQTMLRRVQYGVLVVLASCATDSLRREIDERLGRLRSGALRDLRRRFPGLLQKTKARR
jgi:AcrR family transcriptional regulator